MVDNFIDDNGGEIIGENKDFEDYNNNGSLLTFGDKNESPYIDQNNKNILIDDNNQINIKNGNPENDNYQDFIANDVLNNLDMDGYNYNNDYNDEQNIENLPNNYDVNNGNLTFNNNYDPFQMNNSPEYNNQKNKIVLKLAPFPIEDFPDDSLNNGSEDTSEETFSSPNMKNNNNNNYKLRGTNCKMKNKIGKNINNYSQKPDIQDFSRGNWKKFYKTDDPFFNYEKYNNDNNRKIVTFTAMNEENPNIMETYKGEVNEQGEKDGFGQLKSEEVTRIGTWRHNNFTGWGREIWSDGRIYEGKFIKGKLCGKGIYKDDTVFYIGDFNNSIKDGKGEIFTDSYHYIGDFVKDSFEGEGKLDKYGEGSYEANFEDGKINGYGIFKWVNGDFYEGNMKDGRMDGYGKLTTFDRNIYEGQFKNGKFNGNGKLRRNNGMIEKGYFVNGHLIKN